MRRNRASIGLAAAKHNERMADHECFYFFGICGFEMRYIIHDSKVEGYLNYATTSAIFSAFIFALIMAMLLAAWPANSVNAFFDISS